MTFTGLPDADDTITIGTQTFTFKTARSEAGEVTIGNTASETGDNLVAAIAAGENDAGVVTTTATVKGTSGNLITLTANAANTAVSGVTDDKLDGGIDGTVGAANEICADASYIYHCTAANTATDANWRRVALGTVY